MEWENTLCHYTTAEAAFKHIIPWGELRMSPYARMRDPLENRDLPFGGGGFAGDAKQQTELLDKIADHIRRVRDATRLVSFTIDAQEGYAERDLPFMRAWARARMWEQYASNHAGVCLVFDREVATRAIMSHLHTLGSVGEGEVRYTPQGFRDTAASTLMLDEFRPDELHQDAARFVVDNNEAIFFTKTHDWQSEHEYRFTLFTDSTDEYVAVPFGDATSVLGVVLGERFPKWQVPAARWACEQVGVELLQMEWQVGLPWPMTIQRADGSEPVVLDAEDDDDRQE